MKNFFQKNGIMMLAAVTVVAVLLCVASALSSQTGFLQNAGGVIASPCLLYTSEKNSPLRGCIMAVPSFSPLF